jgi:imidazolonepropionase-like amidohydrolase
MKTFVRCGHLFTGQEDDARAGETLVFDEAGMLDYVGPAKAAPRPARNDHVLDYSAWFVMPGLVDVHTHLAYGNAKSEEDIDLYSPLEFRTLRGMFFAQKVAAAGFTAICSPGDAGQISLSIRNAIRAGLFDGPRVMAAGRYVTTHQGLTDWYPTWIGAPETSIGKLVTTSAEAVEEIRRQVKDGVDCIKIALDGIQRRENGELVAAFTQDETEIMVRETHRLGKKAIAHARGREATLYAARSGIDLIFHANHLDGECIAAMLETGSTVCPTLTHPRNTIDFTQPHDPAFQRGRPESTRREYDIGCANWKKARAAGVPLLTGTDTGFAVTPYGEWNARELELFVDDLGFTPAAALRAASGLHDRGRPDRRARTGSRRRFHRPRLLASQRHPAVAGPKPDQSRPHRRQGDPHPRPRLRSAPGYRLRTGQLDRSLHPRAGRRIAPAAPPPRRRRVAVSSLTAGEKPALASKKRP